MRLHQRDLTRVHTVVSGRVVWIDEIRVVVAGHRAAGHRDCEYLF